MRLREHMKKAVNEDELSEINKRSFEGQIRKAKKDKNRLQNLKSTIQSMADGGMLSKNDTSDLMNSINKLL